MNLAGLLKIGITEAFKNRFNIDIIQPTIQTIEGVQIILEYSGSTKVNDNNV